MKQGSRIIVPRFRNAWHISQKNADFFRLLFYVYAGVGERFPVFTGYTFFMSPKVKVSVIMLVAIVLSSIGEALAAKAMKQVDENAPLLRQLQTALGDWHVWVGLFLLLCYVLLYVYSLSLAELSLVLPLSASSYLIGIFLSKYYLKEDIPVSRWIGTVVIIAGVLIIAWSGFAEKAKK